MSTLKKIGSRLATAGKAVGTEVKGIAQDIAADPKVKKVTDKVATGAAKALLVTATVLAKGADKILDKKKE